MSLGKFGNLGLFTLTGSKLLLWFLDLQRYLHACVFSAVGLKSELPGPVIV